MRIKGQVPDSEKALQIDLMKWNVERLEVANLSIIQRATNCVGFSVVELGLLANLLFTKVPKSNLVKISLELAVACVGSALVLFMFAVWTKSDGEAYENKDFLGKNSDEIIQMLHNSCGCKVSEEFLQSKENERRSKYFTIAIFVLALSVLPFVIAVGQGVFQ